MSSPRQFLKRWLEHSHETPLPLWMLFPVIFIAGYLCHATLLHLPYYWDEAGYYIPAAWDFFRTGTLIPTSTLTNAHPPLPSIYLALWWKIFGFAPTVTREAVLFISSFALLAVWKLVLRLTGVAAIAFWTMVLSGLYPVWFAQSTLAHADIFAATGTLWGLVLVLPLAQSSLPHAETQKRVRSRRLLLIALCFSLAALSKETSIVTPVVLAGVQVAAAIQVKNARARTRLLLEAAALLFCLLPLAGWYVYHWSKTGFLFGNPEFLRYNATSTLDPIRIVAAFAHRLLHLTAHMNLFVPVLLAIAAIFLNPVSNQQTTTRIGLRAADLRRILLVLGANAVAFSVLGGALLTRYLLPMYPLVLVICVSAMYRHVRWWQLMGAFSAAAFILGLFIDPFYGFAPEDNLAYAQVIRLHQQAIYQLEQHYPNTTVLTAWPVSDELTKPELGYVDQPWQVYRLEDFTEAQIAHAASEPNSYDAALVFSTKYDPPLPFSFGGADKSLSERYFGLHHDLKPERIAELLRGTVDWQAGWRPTNNGQWAAVLGFHPTAMAEGR